MIGLWDGGRLDQVLNNLLTNAIKFGQGKPITIELLRRAGIAGLKVIDHGLGMDEVTQNRVMHPYERGVSAHHYGGLGLGLYIVHTIVSGLGGRFTLKSKIGEGTQAIVELPIGEESK